MGKWITWIHQKLRCSHKNSLDNKGVGMFDGIYLSFRKWSMNSLVVIKTLSDLKYSQCTPWSSPLRISNGVHLWGISFACILFLIAVLYRISHFVGPCSNKALLYCRGLFLKILSKLTLGLWHKYVITSIRIVETIYHPCDAFNVVVYLKVIAWIKKLHATKTQGCN